jgi:hypothetical protein
VGNAVGEEVAGNVGGKVAEKFITRAVSGLAGGLASAVVRGGRISAAQIATDAFGNALGQSLADKFGQKTGSTAVSQQEKELQAREDARDTAMWDLVGGSGARGDIYGLGTGGSSQGLRFGDRGLGFNGVGGAGVPEANPIGFNTSLTRSAEQLPIKSTFDPLEFERIGSMLNRTGGNQRDLLFRPEDEGSLTPVFKTQGHNYIGVKSWQDVFGRNPSFSDPNFRAFHFGSMYPDFPTDDPNSGRTLGALRFGREYEFGNKDSLVQRSHFGDLSIWHSMTPSSNLTNTEVLDKIIDQQREWWNSAIAARTTDRPELGFFHVGKIVHSVTDSFPSGHTLRDSDGNVVSFRYYDDVNRAQGHSAQDQYDPTNFLHKRALGAATQVLRFYDQGAKFQDVEIYLRNEVYKIAEGAALSRSGGNIGSPLPIDRPAPREPDLGGPRPRSQYNTIQELGGPRRIPR